MTVLIDGENVRRSRWPNLSKEDLVELVRRWSEAEGLDALVVFDGSAPEGAVGSGRETADDWLAREAPSYAPYWLVTSDRELRERAGEAAERVLGGGAFLGLLSEFEAEPKR